MRCFERNCAVWWRGPANSMPPPCIQSTPAQCPFIYSGSMLTGLVERQFMTELLLVSLDSKLAVCSKLSIVTFWRESCFGQHGDLASSLQQHSAPRETCQHVAACILSACSIFGKRSFFATSDFSLLEHISEVGGECNQGVVSFHFVSFVRACVHAVWLPSGIRFQKRLATFFLT